MNIDINMNSRQKWVVGVAAVLLLFFVGFHFFMPQGLPGVSAEGQTGASAETPYGESLEIELTSGAETSGEASIWEMSYTDSQSQDVYDVNGTYKSQEQVTLEYSLSITYSNVGSITNVETSIKALDQQATPNTYTYTLATSKSLSGSSPISDSGSQTISISQHLGTDIGVPDTTQAIIDYEIYCKVTAVGTVSGETLTAEIAYTPFSTLEYTQTGESSQADVTPNVSVAGWWSILNTPGIAILVTVIVAGLAYIKLSNPPTNNHKKHPNPNPSPDPNLNIELGSEKPGLRLLFMAVPMGG